ncbi:SRPBCC domain-containing protein [Halocola ammonii]
MQIKSDNIFQVVELNAKPSEVYEALMNSKKHRDFTRMKASISEEEGGQFETCNKRVFGFTTKLIKNKKIVQAWSHKNFPGQQFSVVDIELEKTKNGTRLNFNHIGVPEICAGWLTEMWRKTYWMPLENYFEKAGKKKLATAK